VRKLEDHVFAREFYEEFVKWASDSVEFEKKLARQAFSFSEKEMLSLMRQALLSGNLKDHILEHENGPAFLLENKLYLEFDRIVQIVSIEVDGIRRLGDKFNNFLKNKSRTAISKWNNPNEKSKFEEIYIWFSPFS
jgi:hypothetical protein